MRDDANGIGKRRSFRRARSECALDLRDPDASRWSRCPQIDSRDAAVVRLCFASSTFRTTLSRVARSHRLYFISRCASSPSSPASPPCPRPRSPSVRVDRSEVASDDTRRRRQRESPHVVAPARSTWLTLPGPTHVTHTHHAHETHSSVSHSHKDKKEHHTHTHRTYLVRRYLADPRRRREAEGDAPPPRSPRARRAGRAQEGASPPQGRPPQGRQEGAQERRKEGAQEDQDCARVTRSLPLHLRSFHPTLSVTADLHELLYTTTNALHPQATDPFCAELTERRRA